MASEKRSEYTASAWEQLRRHLRMQRSATPERPVSEEEAAWFLGLPDKIKRRHFTVEEQGWMQSKSELLMSSTCLPEGRPVTAPTTSLPTFQISSSALSLPTHECFELPAEVPADFLRSEMEQCPLGSHPVVSSPFLPAQKSTPSLQSLPSSSSVMGLPKSPRLGHANRRAPPSPINTSAAIYIGDAGNMAKVRELLSSPLVPLPTSAPAKSYFDTSFFDAPRDDDASSATEINDPLTPDEMKLGRGKTSYFDLKTPYNDSPAQTPGLSMFDDFLRSDMTLKLTLTRPDIRSDDMLRLRKDCAPKLPELYHPIDEMDPLALDPLVYSDDATGQHGPFAKDEQTRKKGFKGLFGRKQHGLRA